MGKVPASRGDTIRTTRTRSGLQAGSGTTSGVNQHKLCAAATGRHPSRVARSQASDGTADTTEVGVSSGARSGLSDFALPGGTVESPRTAIASRSAASHADSASTTLLIGVAHVATSIATHRPHEYERNGVNIEPGIIVDTVSVATALAEREDTRKATHGESLLTSSPNPHQADHRASLARNRTAKGSPVKCGFDCPVGSYALRGIRLKSSSAARSCNLL